MGHFSLASGAPPSLAFEPATQSARIQLQDCSAYKCITYSVLAKCDDWQYSCTLGFQSHFKLVMFLGIRTGRHARESESAALHQQIELRLYAIIFI
jgi:hypothetical protein